MNRFLRISFIVGMAYTLVSLLVGSITGVMYPFGCYTMIWLGTLIFMLGVIITKLDRYDILFKILGIIIEAAGFIFIIINKCITVYYVIHAIMLIGSVLLAVFLKHNTIHRDFAAKFKFSVLAMLLLFCLMGLMTGGSENVFFDMDFTVAAMINSIPSFIVSIVMGILLLRGLRAAVGIVDETEFNKRQLRDTVTFFGGCVLVIVTGLPELLVRFVELIAENLINPMLLWIQKLMYNFAELLVNKNPPQLPNNQGVVQTTPNAVDITPMSTPGLTPSVTAEQVEDRSNEMTKILLILFAIIVGAAILYVVISKLFKRGKRVVSFGYPYEESETIEDDGERREKPVSRHSRLPRQKIRYYYYTFLKHIHSKCGKLKRSDTCEQVADTAEKLDEGHMQELMEFSNVYRKARYNFSEEPTSEDAKQAKRLLDLLNKQKR